MSNFQPDALGKALTGWRLRLDTIIFEADACAWRWSDQVLIVRILRLLRALPALRALRAFKMTAVDFGDIAPKTDWGRLIGLRMMLLGRGTLAVLTGGVTSEVIAQRYQPSATRNRTCQEWPDGWPSGRGKFLSPLRRPALRLCI